MKTLHGIMVSILMGAALAVGGCAGDGLLGGGQTTSALPEKPKVDPACVSLASQIDGLRKDGVADRVAAAAQGKGATVNVKRELLAKVDQLNKANAAFQMKCGTVAPSPTTAQPAAAPMVPPAAAAKAVKAVSSTPAVVAAKTKAAAVAGPAIPGVAVPTAPAVAAGVAREVAGTPAKTE